MRHLFLGLALAGLLGAAVPAHAFLEVNLTGGYSTLAMGDLNDQISAGATSSAAMNSGWYLALDAGVSLMPILKIDPRVSYVQSAQGTRTVPAFTTTIDANIVPMELGLSLDLSIPVTGLSARVGAWGGYGMATVQVASKSNGVTTYTNLYQGGAFTGEVVGALRYKIAPFFSLGLEAGYRLANVAELKDSTGAAFKNAATNKTIAADFSGVNLGGGLTFSF